MKLKFKSKKWRDMTTEELENEKKFGKALAYLGCFSAFFFILVGMIRLMMGKANFIEGVATSLMFVVSLIGIIQIVIIDYEIRFRKLEEGKRNE